MYILLWELFEKLNELGGLTQFSQWKVYKILPIPTDNNTKYGLMIIHFGHVRSYHEGHDDVNWSTWSKPFFMARKAKSKMLSTCLWKQNKIC